MQGDVDNSLVSQALKVPVGESFRIRMWLTPVTFELSSFLSLWLRLESGVSNHICQGNIFLISFLERMKGFFGVRPGISASLGKNKEFSWLRQRRGFRSCQACD